MDAFKQKGDLLLRTRQDVNESLSQVDRKKQPEVYKEHLTHLVKVDQIVEDHIESNPLDSKAEYNEQNKEVPDNSSLAENAKNPESSTTPRGLCGLSFEKNKAHLSEEKVSSDLTKSPDQSGPGTDTSDTLNVAGFTI